MENRKYISWIRVSTRKQGDSGLGLEAQQELIRMSMGYDPVTEFKDIYTGTSLDKCVALRSALSVAKTNGYLLVVAKADRFRSDIEALKILDEIGEDNIKFCDCPGSGRLVLTVLFAVYRHQAMMGRINTKIALKQLKGKIDRGEKPVSKNSGNEVTHLGRAKGTKAKEDWAKPSEYLTKSFRDKFGSDTARRRQWLLVHDMRQKGETMAKIADTMNAIGELTPRECKWSSGSICAVLDKWGDYFLEENQI
jgi:hypothetical protein